MREILDNIKEGVLLSNQDLINLSKKQRSKQKECLEPAELTE